MASDPTISCQIDGETMETVTYFICLCSKITADSECSHEIKKKMLSPWKKSYDQPRLCIKKQRHYFLDKGPYCQRYHFSSSHVWMWDLDHKEGWTPKNWSFWTVVLEKTIESPLDRKDIKQVNLKGNQSWILIEGTDAATETPVLWSPDVKSQIIGKDPDAGKDWVQEGKWMTEDGMVGWHPWLNGQELSKLFKMVKDRETWHAEVHRVAK